jgi:hypothetical protein
MITSTNPAVPRTDRPAETISTRSRPSLSRQPTSDGPSKAPRDHQTARAHMEVPLRGTSGP